MRSKQPISLFLCGDVMTGRGIDQILPHPSDPVLYEPWVRDARDYVALAEAAHGPIPRPVDFSYVWGDALEELRRAGPDLRIINLETSITASEEPWSGKEIHYRMHPANVASITAAGVDCCCLANNHLLDWQYEGLEETLATLDNAGVRHAGAGRNYAEARSPAVLDVPEKGRVLVFALGSTSSGIPVEWGATGDRPGIHLLEDLSEASARRITSEMRQMKRGGDVVVASIHWGSNWGYEIPDPQVDFAHRLVEGGVDLIHGHSSHHVKAIEIYRGRLILYGCGDFLTDYEGIHGYEEFRGDLTLMYFADLDPEGRLVELRFAPMQLRRFRLNRASEADTEWLCRLLNDVGARFGTRVRLKDKSSMELELGATISACTGPPGRAAKEAAADAAGVGNRIGQR